MKRIAVVADDLIWASRLTDAVRRAGAEPVRLSGTAAAAWSWAVPTTSTVEAPSSRGAPVSGRSGMPAPAFDGAIVDMALRAIDPMAAIAAAHDAGTPVLAVANHDDVALRKRALAAGAGKVLAYRKMHHDGAAVVAAWISGLTA